MDKKEGTQRIVPFKAPLVDHLQKGAQRAKVDVSLVFVLGLPAPEHVLLVDLLPLFAVVDHTP